MRTALITTTINIPHVLTLYRKIAGPYVRFFVAGDMKSDSIETLRWCREHIPNCAFLDAVEQQSLGYKCSELIGWNCVQRRNIALLEALRWGADVIVSIDTDDFPLSAGHFPTVDHLLSTPFNGIELRSGSGWVDPGWLVSPPIAHRGMPSTLDRFFCHPAVDRRIGVVASTVLGSCDLSAYDRLAGAEKRHRASALADAGVVVDPAVSYTLFNSEAVAFTRDLAPAAFMLPHVGRYDDLFASLILQRVMAERELCTHFGRPAVWHERADRNLLTDLKNEMFGMEYVLHFTTLLDDLLYLPAAGSAVEQVRHIFAACAQHTWVPKRTVEAGLAWCDDCEQVLA